MKKILLTIVALLCIVGSQANAKVVDGEKMLFPSYWRNEATGNWDIAFLGDYAIYDCKIWDMKAEVNEKSGEADITLSDGNKT